MFCWIKAVYYVFPPHLVFQQDRSLNSSCPPLVSSVILQKCIDSLIIWLITSSHSVCPCLLTKLSSQPECLPELLSLFHMFMWERAHRKGSEREPSPASPAPLSTLIVNGWLQRFSATWTARHCRYHIKEWYRQCRAVQCISSRLHGSCSFLFVCRPWWKIQEPSKRKGAAARRRTTAAPVCSWKAVCLSRRPCGIEHLSTAPRSLVQPAMSHPPPSASVFLRLCGCC